MSNIDYYAVLKEVKSSLEDLTGLNPSEIKEESQIIIGLGLDSLEVSVLIVDLGEKLGIDIPNDYLDNFSKLNGKGIFSDEKQQTSYTVKELSNYVLGLVDKKIYS